MNTKQQPTAGISKEYRVSASPQAVVNKWITIGILALIWLSLVISLLR
ncbi:hypothetical protein [Flavihumibacter sp. CACIAM 22H1]|nr:hypothetical protein [Flavihumibacter sp. CACIAM 22H1]